MHWTFDPLQSRNAYLNFAKLGIIVREYAADMYGETDSPCTEASARTASSPSGS